jgi:thiamine-monophosphate kinase
MARRRPPEDRVRDLEPRLLERLRALATHPAARGLADDAAVLAWPLGLDLVATSDMLAEGVHFTPYCPPADIGWKLVAVNLSDLAAMGAKPVAVLMGAGIGGDRDPAWAEALVAGVGQALARYTVPLVGGDTIRAPDGSVLALTALGSVPPGAALGRGGAGEGDDLWVSGTIGDAGLGLGIARGAPGDPALLKRYRRPTPRLALGLALRGIATAAIDVSDGLFLDAARLAEASGLAAAIEGASIPLSDPARASGVGIAALAAMGDDYELLFAAPVAERATLAVLAADEAHSITRIGRLVAGRFGDLVLDGKPYGGPRGWRHR